MADYLLINNNNTRTKFALADRDKLHPTRSVLDTRDLTAELLRQAVRDWSYDHIVLASVVPPSAELIRQSFPGRTIIEVDHRADLGIELDFPDPSTIGADRIANAVAVVELRGEAPAVVVDFGTAVTFDIISPQRAYVGGIIAPGLDVMTDYLNRRTALLPKIDLSEPAELVGKSTRSAMLSGAVHGYRGLVKEILARLREELLPGAEGRHPFTVATGGYADLISARVSSIDLVWPDLTMEGIRVIANRNRLDGVT